MKVNFYEAFEFIDEEATEILAEYDNNTLATMQYSPDVTIREVLGKKKHIHTKQKKKLNMKLRLLVAAIIILAVSSVSYATYRGNLKENGGAEIIDDNNRKWIGTIFEREATVTDAKGKVKDKKSNQFSEQYDWKSSSVIKSIQSGAPIPQTVNEFLTKSEKKIYITPEVIFTNNSMVIFTKENGDGWKLKKGETLQFMAEEYPSDINNGNGQHIIYQTVFNGKLMKKSVTSDKTLAQNYQIKAEKNGEYYICLIGASSDSIALKEGKILINQK